MAWRPPRSSRRLPGGRRGGGRGRHRHRRHRLAADLDGAGHDHAARPRPVLRRPGPPQERAVDDHAQLLRPGPRQRRLGRGRLLARVRAGRRRARASSAASTSSGFIDGRPDPQPDLRPDDPVRPVRGVPADVRGDHAGPDHRRLRRAQAVRRRSSCSRSCGRSSSTPRVAHWVWSVDGWLFKLGALDFAGGTVVHASSGVSALVVALLIGRRVVNGDGLEPHDIPMTVLGAGLLWFGWFGFNAGSAVAANGLAANACSSPTPPPPPRRSPGSSRATSTGARSASSGPPAGAVAGLVAITPASGFVTAGGALAIGLVAGGLCYSATLLRGGSTIDDALDVFAVHGVGGMFGAVATGVFASTAINAADSRPDRRQPAASSSSSSSPSAPRSRYAVVATFVIVKVVDFLLASASRRTPRRWASTSRSTARSPTRSDPDTVRRQGPAPAGRGLRGGRRPATQPQPGRCRVGVVAAHGPAHDPPSTRESSRPDANGSGPGPSHRRSPVPSSGSPAGPASNGRTRT